MGVIAEQSSSTARDFGRTLERQKPLVQRKPSPNEKGNAASARAQADAPMVLWVMDDVFEGRARLIDQAPSAYRAAIGQLLTVKNGSEGKYGFPIPGRRRREMFDEVMRVLDPIIAYANVDEKNQLEEIRRSVLLSEAHDRVENSFSDNNGKALEIPTDSHPREQAELLRSQLRKLISSMHDINEIALKYGEKQIEDVVEHMAEGHPGHGEGNTLGRLQEMQAILTVADGWLKLRDEEFQHELTHIRDVFHGVSTYAELLKAVLEMGSGGVSLTATFAAGIAKLSGDAALAATASSLARQVGMKFGNVIAGIEIVHGAVMLINPHSNLEQRIEGGVEVGMGVGFLAGGGVGATVVGGPYFLAKTAATLYWEAALGLNTGFFREVFGYMKEQGGFIAANADALARAGMLRLEEKDSGKAAALATEEHLLAIKLGSVIDSFLDRCQSSGGRGQGLGQESQQLFPGNYSLLAEAFAPLLGRRGAKTGPEAAAAAAAVLSKISWCFENANYIVIASVRHKNISEMEKGKAKEKAAHQDEEKR